MGGGGGACHCVVPGPISTPRTITACGEGDGIGGLSASGMSS